MSEYSTIGVCYICNTYIFADESFVYNDEGNMICDYCKEVL